MSNIDYNFLREMEGFETTGYVPKDKDGKALEQSGVTIGSGIDLGQWGEKQLKALGVPEKTISKVKPYLGKKKQDAINFLDKNPLALSEEEANELTASVKDYFAENVAKKYNKDSSQKFEELPPEIQTAITSVAFQYGNKVYDHNFWKQVTEGKWEDAYNNLRDYKDSYPTRRNREADLFLQALQPQENIPVGMDNELTPIQTYQVESGDTLSSISRKLGISVADLVSFNNITDPNMIQPGAELQY